MSRFFQVLLITSTIAFSWLGMMVVHECEEEKVPGTVIHGAAVF